MPPYPEWLGKATVIVEGRTVGEAMGLLKQEVPDAGKPSKPNKYRNSVVEWEGARFHSKKELNRWLELVELQKLGAIRNLRRQVKYDLIVNDVRVTGYVADHVYEEWYGIEWVQIIEDVKGVRTPEYRLKRNLMRALYGITIREV